MNTFDLTLDLSKQVSMEPLRLRQGDKSGTTVRATVYDHGTLVSGSYTARIAMRHPGTGATYYRETGTFSNGVATFTIDEQYAATVTGRTTGYVQLLQGSTVIASTADFPVVILRDATEGAVPGEVYDSAIEDALAELDEATGRISVMVQEQVAEELAAHPEWTTTVTDGSVTDAKLVQTGGILSRVDRLMYRLDNLLTGDTGEQEVAVVADAAATPVAGLSVYGRSVQDGTPTPSAPVPIQSVEGNIAATPFERFNWASSRGVTFSQNADGTVTASGTATSMAFVVICDDSHNTLGLVAGETYTVAIDHVSGETDNVRAMTTAGGANGTKRYVFEIPSEGTWTVGAQIATGFTADETFRISVYRGAHPELAATPYDTACLFATGRNVIMVPVAGVTYSATKTNDATRVVMHGLPIPTLAAGTEVTLSFEGRASVGGVPARMYAGSYTEDAGSYANSTSMDANILTTEWARYTQTITLTTDVCVVYATANTSTGTTGVTYEVRNPMLVIGGGIAPALQEVTVTPVPLAGHVLRSLPDGTRDEVTVDARGHAVLVQRVGEVTLDGSENWLTSSTANCVYLSLTGVAGNVRTERFVDNALCDRYAASIETLANMANPSFKLGAATGGNTDELLYVKDGAHASTGKTEYKAWLAENPITVLYPLATPVTHDLGYVDPVALTSPDATMQAVTGIATTFRADYERDLNVTLARLEAAIATLA